MSPLASFRELSIAGPVAHRLRWPNRCGGGHSVESGGVEEHEKKLARGRSRQERFRWVKPRGLSRGT
jgi:hypothetical protein